MLYINVIVLLCVSFFLGYYYGKGKIVIVKTMNKKELEEEKKKAEQQIKEIEDEIQNIMKGGEF